MNKAILSFNVSSECDLLNFLILHLTNKSKNNIKSFLLNGCVYINGSIVKNGNYILKIDDEVDVILKQIRNNNYCIDVIYEDDYFIAVNKPNGIVSVDDMKSKYSIYSIVRNYINKQNKKLFILHRLDRDTSGILLFCKDVNIRDRMQNNWDNVVSKRGYLVITPKFNNKMGSFKSYLYEDRNYVVRSSNKPSDGKIAITNYKVIASNKKYSLLQVFLETGRKNQIRVHMQSLNKSVLGDKKYGGEKSDRLYLHSNILEFIHPVYNKLIEIKCPCDFYKYF